MMMMKLRPQFPANYRLLRPLLHPARASSAVAWQQLQRKRQRRLSGTAAARQVSAEGASKRRVSRDQRKAMVEAYVAKYRMEHGGKFPTASVTRKQVGGGYYFLREILQKLEHNSKLPTVGTMDEIAGQTDEVNDISISSKDVDVISGEVLSGQVLVATTSVSNEYGILAENGTSSQGGLSNNYGERGVDVSIVTQNNEMPTVDDSTIVGSTAKHKGISEIGEVLVDKTIVSEAYIISADDDTSCEAKSNNNEDEGMVDSGAHCNEISTETEDSQVGRTAQVNGISGVGEVLDSEVITGTTSDSNNYGISPDDGCNSQVEVGESSGQMMLDTPLLDNEGSATDEDSTVGRPCKTTGISESRGVVDSDMLVGKSIGSNDYGIPTDNGSSSQAEANKNSGQTMTYAPISTNHNEVFAKDETSTARQAVQVKEISKEDSEVPSKPDHPSQVPGASNTKLGKLDESSQASGSDQLTREKTQNEQHEASLWHSLKSFASSIISIWRK